MMTSRASQELGVGRLIEDDTCTLNIFHRRVNFLLNMELLQDNYQKSVLGFFYQSSPSFQTFIEFSNHAVLSMSDSTMAVSSKYTQDLSVQIAFFTFSFK